MHNIIFIHYWLKFSYIANLTIGWDCKYVRKLPYSNLIYHVSQHVHAMCLWYNFKPERGVWQHCLPVASACMAEIRKRNSWIRNLFDENSKNELSNMNMTRWCDACWVLGIALSPAVIRLYWVVSNLTNSVLIWRFLFPKTL